MKKLIPWWKKNKKQTPISLLEKSTIDSSTLSEEIKSSNITLSGKLLYMSDIYNTVMKVRLEEIMNETGNTSPIDLKLMECMCKDKHANYSVVDLIMLLTIPKTDKTDLFKLFSTTPELRIVYTEDSLCTYVLIGSTIQGYRNLILNTKNQVNTVLNTIKNVLYENCYCWPFMELINLGLMENYFIEPGVDCFWENSDTEVQIDEKSLDNNINKQIEYSLIRKLESKVVTYINDDYESFEIELFNLPNAYQIYKKYLMDLGFCIYDAIKVFGFGYIINGYGNIMHHVTIYDAIVNYHGKKYHPESAISDYFIKEDTFTDMIFGPNSSDISIITEPPCLRTISPVKIDEFLGEEIIEEDISEEETYIIGDDEEVLSGDMPIPKFDVDRYKGTRLVEDDAGESSGKYDL